MLFKRGARDFFEKEEIKYSVDDLESHHIFPSKFLEIKGVNVDKDIVLNRTLILSKTNRKISRKAPSAYIKEMVKIHGDEAKVRQILDKHFINYEMFELLKSVTEDSTSDEIKKKFQRFIEIRRSLIKNEIKKLVEVT